MCCYNLRCNILRLLNVKLVLIHNNLFILNEKLCRVKCKFCVVKMLKLCRD